MDHAAVARKIRQAIFDEAEANGRVMSASRTDEVIEGILKEEAPNQQPAWYGAVAMCADANRHDTADEWR